MRLDNAHGTVFAASKVRLDGVLSMDLPRLVHLHFPRKQSALVFQQSDGGLTGTLRLENRRISSRTKALRRWPSYARLENVHKERRSSG